MVGAVAFAPCVKNLLAVPNAAPVMRIGVMSDTHINDTLESCNRVAMACRLFRTRNVDLILNLGDVANYYYPSGYRFYRQVVAEAYAGAEKPMELFAYAGHDILRFAGPGTHFPDARLPEAYQAVKRDLEIPNEPADCIDFRGYKFVMVPEYVNNRYDKFSSADYEKLVADACAATPDKPVFVLDHEPPQGTVYNSFAWGRKLSYDIFKKYPQVVSLSGHVHGSLHNDVNIWQGAFTAINAGCLQYWSGVTTGTQSVSKPSFDVMTIDVYADRLVVRRWDVRDQSEIDPAHPWIVPLPFDPATAPYARARRTAAEPLPKFSADAKLAAVAVGTPFAGFQLKFPAVEKAMLYRIEAQMREGSEWKTFSWMETFSDYWKSPKDRTDFIEFLLKESYFEPGRDYRITVAGVNQYGCVGEPIAAEVKTPSSFAPRKLLFSARGEDLVFYHMNEDLTHVVHKPDAEGFYGPFNDGSHYIELPANLFAGEPNSRFRLTLDMRTIQPEEGTVWDLKFQDPTTWFHCTERTATPHGDSGRERYVMELKKANLTKKDTYHVCFSWASPGRVKFYALKLERL